MRAAHAAVGLGLVAALGIGMRLLPLTSFALWGSDTGEYHRLVAGLLSEGRLDLGYPGWGIAYPWFPGLFAIAGAVSATTGLDPRLTLDVLIPALAGLCALAVALLAYEVSRDARAALLAGAAAAVVMPHAFATSHAMPGAVGHLFLLGALLLVWDAGRDRGALVACLLCCAALVATHHLSTYMFLAALGGMALLRAVLVAKPARSRHRTTLLVLGATLLMALAWWTWARPIREQIAPSASSLGLAGLAVLAFIALAVLAWLPRVRARWPWRFRPAWPNAARGLRVVAAMFVVVLVGSAIVGFVGVPGTSVQVTPLAVLWFLPLIALASFGFLGSQLAKFRPRGVAVYGWVLALLASFFLATVAGSKVLLPYRHAEYILEPAALLAGLGLAAAVGLAQARSPRAGTFAALGAVALILANGALAYPRPEILAGFQEGTTAGELQGVQWAGAHLRLAPGAVVAADHRLSSMLFGFAGLNATWEYAPLTFHAASFREAEQEMRAVHSPSGVKRVDYVVLTSAMREHLALLQWEAARPLSKEAQAKFDEDRGDYVPVCGGPTQEVAIYQVNWGHTLPQPVSVAPCA